MNIPSPTSPFLLGSIFDPKDIGKTIGSFAKLLKDILTSFTYSTFRKIGFSHQETYQELELEQLRDDSIEDISNKKCSVPVNNTISLRDFDLKLERKTECATKDPSLLTRLLELISGGQILKILYEAIERGFESLFRYKPYFPIEPTNPEEPSVDLNILFWGTYENPIHESENFPGVYTYYKDRFDPDKIKITWIKLKDAIEFISQEILGISITTQKELINYINGIKNKDFGEIVSYIYLKDLYTNPSDLTVILYEKNKTITKEIKTPDFLVFKPHQVFFEAKSAWSMNNPPDTNSTIYKESVYKKYITTYLDLQMNIALNTQIFTANLGTHYGFGGVGTYCKGENTLVVLWRSESN